MISGSSAFSKSSLYIWKFSVHVLLKPSFNDFERDLASIDFPGDTDGKESACNAGDLGSIPELGISPGKENAIHSSFLAWKIPWTEEPGRLRSVYESQRVGHD